jgi:hypothetical protein
MRTTARSKLASLRKSMSEGQVDEQASDVRAGTTLSRDFLCPSSREVRSFTCRGVQSKLHLAGRGGNLLVLSFSLAIVGLTAGWAMLSLQTMKGFITD